MYAVPSIHTVIIVCKYENLLLCVEASQSTVLPLKIRHPLCNKKSSFEAIRDGMKKTLEGDERLDFSDETLEQRRIIRMRS